MANKEDVARLIIGVDFGTTYSGVSYAFTHKPDQIHTITKWPGAGGRSFPKCPTLISYDATGKVRWGYELDRSSDDRIEGIKLLLDPDQETPMFAPQLDAEIKLRKLGKSATSVATDYIRELFKHALSIIEGGILKDYVNLVEKQYVLSVPAVWSDKAKNATLCAARNAGIHPINLIKEPEAAALFTMHDLQSKGLSIGDTFVLCDAGGGTVDLISYEISGFRPLEIKELTECTGKVAGSLVVNLRFEDWIKKIVGESAFCSLRTKAAFQQGIKSFDEFVKPGFHSEKDDEQFVTFPKANLQDHPDQGLEFNTITITGKRLMEIFDPVCREVLQMVKDQVTSVRLRKLEAGDFIFNGAILLVGGFGSSPHLLERISQAHPNIQVIQPTNAWSAIVRGAVMSQLPSEARVISNFAPKHYGVKCSAAWNAVRDKRRTRFWDEHGNRYRVDWIEWYIHRGSELLRSQKIEFSFYQTFDPDPSDAQLQIKSRLLESTENQAPVYPDSDTTSLNCTLKVDLSKVPKYCFKRKSVTSRLGEKINYWELDYKLLVTIQSGPMVFSLVCNGLEYGRAEAEY